MSREDLIAAARQASDATGLTVEAVLCHYIAENGWDVPGSLNFANILYQGDVGRFGTLPWHKGAHLAYRLDWGGWMIAYESVAAWTAAYAALIASDNQQPLALAIAMSQAPGITDPTLVQLTGLAVTPWDADHYGGDGHKLTDLRPAVRQLLGLGEVTATNQVTVPAPASAPADLTDTEVLTLAMQLLTRWYGGAGAYGKAGIHGTAETLRYMAAEAGLGELADGPSGYPLLQLPDGTVI